MKTTTYTIEEAITVARNCSTFNRPFSIQFKKIGGGHTLIQHASLRPMASTKSDRYGKYKLQLTNEDNGEPRSCYIPLIMAVNGIKVD